MSSENVHLNLEVDTGHNEDTSVQGENDGSSIITSFSSSETTIEYEESSKVDVIWDLTKLKSKPSTEVWVEETSKFCKRFPGHPDCSNGITLEFSNLENILGSLKNGISQYLPRIPEIEIEDPLEGLDFEFRELLGDIPEFGELYDEDAEIIKESCNDFQCTEQSEENRNTKKLLEAKMYEAEKSVFDDEEDFISDIQLRLVRTQQLKEELLAKANLTGVVLPADNGIFESDLLLTVNQADYMLNELGKAGQGAGEVPPPPKQPKIWESQDGKSKRASMFLEKNPNKKWDMKRPIIYWMHDSLENHEKNEIRAALREIQSRTCIKFREARTAPVGQHHIRYYKFPSDTNCGLAEVGRQDTFNNVLISFKCGNAKGIAIHETLHALGVGHQET